MKDIFSSHIKAPLFYILSLLFILSTALLPAQVSINPTDDFYIDAISWQIKRYTTNLPQTKPYPINVIKRVLDDVIEKGDAKSASRAKYYKEKYFTRSFHVFDDFSINIKLKKGDNATNEKVNGYKDEELYSDKVAFISDWAINDLLGLSFNMGAIVRNNDTNKKEVLPRYVVNDDADVILPIKVKADTADFVFNPNFLFTVGNESIYGTFGMNRSGYGLFFDDSLILNPYAYQTLNTSFNYISKYFSYTHSFSVLGATNYDDTESFSFGKFMCFHTLKIPIPKVPLSFSLYESVIFRKPFTPAYFIPVPFFIIANVAGFNENVISGLNIEWAPLRGLAFTADVIFDDFNLNKLLKLKLDEAAVRTGFKVGFIYTPFDSFCDHISVNYTLITPYTYTKYNNKSKTFNYLDYTNFSQSMGNMLPPNSDSVSMTIAWKPINSVTGKIITSFSRHGNAYQDLDNDEVIKLSHSKYLSDGSINMDTKGLDSTTKATDFLKQHDIMYIVQASLFVEYEQKVLKYGAFKFSFQYTFEYINKDGVDNNIFSGRYYTEEEVNASRKAWKNRLHDSFNHYFTIGIKYLY